MNDRVAEVLGVSVAGARQVGGGSLSSALHVELSDGRVVFAKSGGGADLVAEAAGLRWLADAGGVAVPEVLAVTPDVLVLEWVEGSQRLDEEALGTGLAAMHASGAEDHGALPDGVAELRIGPLAFTLPRSDSFAAIYGLLLEALVDRCGLDAGTRGDVAHVAERCEELIPAEPPSRLHGDLWTGNVLAGPGGCPYVIDPAPYGGNREVDLAMFALFGGPIDRVVEAYDEVSPLVTGWRERVELFQLFPLLVHCALFGGSYRAAAARVARCYA